MHFVLPLCCVLVLAGCGDDPVAAPVPTARVEGPEAVDRLGRLQVPVRETAYGQEIWISWLERGQTFGYRYPREKDEAKELALRLYAEVSDGADFGALARKYSNAPGGRAFGFCVLPRDRTQPDVRDRALVLTRTGQRTPVLEWNGGYWFAKRLSDVDGRALEKTFLYTMRQRARGRAIVFLHDDAYPRRVRDKPYPEAKALAHAKGVLDALAQGGDFATLAKRFSHDKKSGERGGVLHATGATQSPEWIRWGDRGYPQRLLDVLLEEGTVGKVYPEPLRTRRGVMVVEVLERKP